MKEDILFNLRKFLAPEIVYGEGALELAGRHALNFGAHKVLVVTDPGVQAAGWTPEVEACLREAGIAFVTFKDVTPNPKDHEVMSGAEVYHREGCDLIIAVGGGSPMDCAKGIGVVAGNGGHILEYEGVDEVSNPGPPLIFIPTTAGTSADVSPFAIITDTTRHVKINLVSKMVIPDIAIVDPATTRTMSPELMADTGMDALCHAFEAMVSTTASPLTEMAALSATRLIAGNLQAAFQNPADMKFRSNMMMASLMAGLAFSNAGLGLVHAMAHSLGGALDLPHGTCNAILMEKIVQFNYQAAQEQYDLLAKVMGLDLGTGEPAEKGARLASGISDLCKTLGFNQRLIDIGVSEEEIPRLAGAAFEDPCLSTNPRSASIGDIERIFHSAYA